MAGGSEGGQTNFWPGFVDALSNMVMAMIFMVLVFMIMMFHYKLNSGVKPVVCATTTQPRDASSAQAAQLAAALAQAKADLAQARTQLAQAQGSTLQGRPVQTAGARNARSVLDHPEALAAQGAFVSSAPQAGESAPSIEGDGAVWTVTFSGRDVRLGDDTRTKLRALFDGLAAKSSHGSRVHLHLGAEATQGDGYSDSRRLAFYRALEIRNLALQAGWPAAGVDIDIVSRANGAAEPRVVIRAADGGVSSATSGAISGAASGGTAP